MEAGTRLSDGDESFRRGSVGMAGGAVVNRTSREPVDGESGFKLPRRFCRAAGDRAAGESVCEPRREPLWSDASERDRRAG